MIYSDYDFDDERNGVDGEAFLNELMARDELRKKNKGMQ